MTKVKVSSSCEFNGCTGTILRARRGFIWVALSSGLVRPFMHYELVAP